MKNILLTVSAIAVLSGLSLIAASQQPCFGPGACQPETWAGPSPTPPTPPTPPARQICMGSFGCMPVQYETAGIFTTATVTLPNGYIVSGISGACFPGWDCPAVRDDADRDLTQRLGQLHRFQRYLGL